jgi:hypothetical protein
VVWRLSKKSPRSVSSLCLSRPAGKVA